MKIRPVILSGGSGSRLWPESRVSLPKQFLPLFNNKSLFKLTLERCISLDLLEPIIVSSKDHGFLIDESVHELNSNCIKILEEEGKNTTFAICLAAFLSKKIDSDEHILIMPSDHLIPDIEILNDLIKSIKQINDMPNWITFGIIPNEPSSAYGYIQKSDDLDSDDLYEVLSFIEKPSLVDAKKYINKNYLWNSGIFFGSSELILKSIKKHALDIYRESQKIFNSLELQNKELIISKDSLSNVRSESIDYAVLQADNSIKVMPFNGKWSDVGSWDALSSLIPQSEDNVYSLDSANNFVISKDKLVGMVGVSDLIVINNDDALLITQKGNSEKLRDLVSMLKHNNRSEAVQHSYEKRPWGKFLNLLDTDVCKVKRLVVYPKQEISLQYHHKRSENWVVVDGIANVILNDDEIILNPGESVYIPCGATHQLINKNDKDVVIIETQTGTYFGEDDIVRISDKYNR